MTNIERNPDGMTRFGTIIRNNAQLMLHTHLKIVTGKIYDKDERYIIMTEATVPQQEKKSRIIPRGWHKKDSGASRKKEKLASRTGLLWKRKILTGQI